MTGISVVVPVMNEAGNAAPLAQEIAGALMGLGECEILFVDDGSTDETVASLLALKDRISSLHVIRHSRNAGQSRAIRTGAMAAHGDILVTLDGDGQNDPADIPRLLEILRANPSVGMACGVRAKRRDSFSRRLASRIGNRIRGALLHDHATDTGCGLKAMRRELYLALPFFDHQHRFLIALARREGAQVRFLAVNHRPRQTGKSKYTNFGRLLVSVQDLLGVMWLLKRFGNGVKAKEET